MSPVDDSYRCVAAFVEALAAAGVTHVSIAPGARSTPLTLCLAAHPDLHLWSHVDERSGAFFALGQAKATGQPTALVCTSGTAAANFFPAIVEAAHAGVPLVVLTADRPPERRGCGSPQTIDQVKMFGDAVREFVEMPDAAAGVRAFGALATRIVARALHPVAGPVHANFPLREPLVPSVDLRQLLGPPSGSDPARSLARAARPEMRMAAADLRGIGKRLAQRPRGVIVAGARDGGEFDPLASAAVAQLSTMLGYPVLAEPLSQFRCGPGFAAPRISFYDSFLRDPELAARLRPEAVVRLGPLPRVRSVTEFLEASGAWQVVLDEPGRWNDPNASADAHLVGDLGMLCRDVVASLPPMRVDPAWRSAWERADEVAGAALRGAVADISEPFEGSVVRALAASLPDDATVLVGNSLTVRAVDAFWPPSSRRFRFLCNFGANGIDGFVSTGLGAASVARGPVVLLTGDLGFYHDLNGLLTARRYGVRATIVVLNNDGGGIFAQMPQGQFGPVSREFFLTPHGLDFRHAAELYGLGYRRVEEAAGVGEAVRAGLAAPRATIVEVPIDPEKSREAHAAARAAVRAALVSAGSGVS